MSPDSDPQAWIVTWSFQYATDFSYFALSMGTPLPPSSFPRAFLIIVMGCMGTSWLSTWALMLMMPHSAEGSAALTEAASSPGEKMTTKK